MQAGIVRFATVLPLYYDVLYYKDTLMFTPIILLAVLAQGLIALFVLQKNRRSLSNRHLFLVCLPGGLGNYHFIITEIPSRQELVLTLLMASVIAQILSFFMFALPIQA